MTQEIIDPKAPTGGKKTHFLDDYKQVYMLITKRLTIIYLVQNK